jgi:alpha/beta superfamily hydrolase
MTAVAYVAKKRTPSPVTGIVAIGLSTFPSGQDTMQPAIMLKSVQVPVLDLYGASDLHEVLSYTEARRKAAQAAGNKAYSAVRVADADHFFTDKYDALKKHILEWLNRKTGR